MEIPPFKIGKKQKWNIRKENLALNLTQCDKQLSTFMLLS